MGLFAAVNSPLSEESVLAFEHGYTLYSSSIMVVWEAQFGDFANCAQTVVDTFISSGEEKWVRQSGLVLFLPHGYEGQGPDHSSGYMERFLSLVAEDDEPPMPSPLPLDSSDAAAAGEDDSRDARKAINMHVCQPTTPAQHFHMLRRHMLSPYRKPLVVFTPKFLLHHGPCASPLKECGVDGSFRVVLEEDKWKRADAPRPERVLLCSGKLYYHLAESVQRRGLGDRVALVRLEQLAPFPFAALERVLRTYGARPAEAVEAGGKPMQVVWVQEEPKNRGAWTWVNPRLDSVLRRLRKDSAAGVVVSEVAYVGRPPSASPATGSYARHKRELERVIDKALAGF